MSHSVTITRTTTTTSTSALILNTGYLKSVPGILKVLELLLGIVCVGIIGHYYGRNYYGTTPELFFFLITVAFLIGTFCLLTACVISLSTSTLIAKTIYEVVYHLVATILYIAAALTLLTEINRYKNRYNYEPYMAAAIIGIIVAVFYLLSTIMAMRQYRGL